MSGHRSDPGRWFEDVARVLGGAYLRYSFTKGTEQEIGFLLDVLALGAQTRVLDVGCGPGRHAHALARRGVPVVGVDLSEPFCRLAAQGLPGATVVRADVRWLPFAGVFERAICLCQGGFGLLRGEDDRGLREIAGALVPGGRLALTAFSAPFARRHTPPGAVLDEATLVLLERTTIRDEQGLEHAAELWTTCFEPDGLVVLAEAAGLECEHVWSVQPGGYAAQPLDEGLPELLMIARRTPHTA